MAVLGYAPFVPAGESLIKELKPIFDCDDGEPAHLVKKYMERVISGDAAFIKQVDECVSKYSYWMEWSRKFLQHMRDFPYTPKLVGITPPISGELIGVLAQMIKEEG